MAEAKDAGVMFILMDGRAATDEGIDSALVLTTAKSPEEALESMNDFGADIVVMYAEDGKNFNRCVTKEELRNWNG